MNVIMIIKFRKIHGFNHLLKICFLVFAYDLHNRTEQHSQTKHVQKHKLLAMLWFAAAVFLIQCCGVSMAALLKLEQS